MQLGKLIIENCLEKEPLIKIEELDQDRGKRFPNI